MARITRKKNVTIDHPLQISVGLPPTASKRSRVFGFIVPFLLNKLTYQ